jgi:hypothetical protein
MIRFNRGVTTPRNLEAWLINIQEKALYHQIHPVKLFTDISTSFMSLSLIWQHNLLAGLSIGIIPSILVSLAVIRFANLKKIKQSSFGRYVGRYMTNEMQAVRLFGQLVIWFGAWYHIVLAVVLGYLAILLGWTRGKLFR